MHGPTAKPGMIIAAGVLLTVMLAGIALDITLFFRLRRRLPALRRRLRFLQERPWQWLDAGVILFLMIWLHTLLLFASSVVHHVGWLPDVPLIAISIFCQTLLFPLIGFTLIIAFMRLRMLSWKQAFGLELGEIWQRTRQGAILYLAVMPPVMLSGLAYSALLGRLNYPIQSQEVVQVLVDPRYPVWLQVYVVILAVTAAPIGEELFFRGIALPALARYAGPTRAILAVSLLFALMHFHVPSVVPLFLLGVALSLGYSLTGSIVVPITIHALFNAVSIAILLLARDFLPFVR